MSSPKGSEPGDADPARAWVAALAAGGYEHSCRSAADFARIQRCGQAWRRILRATGLEPPARAFEIGCGGGLQLATLAANGFDVSGIDVSPEVADRARRYLSEVAQYGSRPIAVDVETSDFFETPADGSFDLVYHFGVVEHYLDAAVRRDFWQRAVARTRPGGYVVSVVPCGAHLMRRRMRERELFGYRHALAETDYTCASHAEEFREAGLTDISVLPHAYFFFLSGMKSTLGRKLVFPAVYGAANLLLPRTPLPKRAAEKLAHTLIAIGRKPAPGVL